MGIHDFKIIMRAMNTIAHEMAHLIFNTKDNTKYHNVMEKEIQDRLVNMF